MRKFLLLFVLLLAFPAQAGIIDWNIHETAGGGSCATLTTQEFHLNAADTASYNTGDSDWKNLIGSPDSTETSTNYGWFKGNDATSTTNDPTFVGTVGVAGAYWDMVAADLDTFNNKLGVAGVTWLNDMPRNTGGDWTLSMAFRLDTVSGVQTLFSTGRGGGASEHGLYVRTSGTGVQIESKCTSSAFATISITVAASTDYVLTLSHDQSGNELDAWLNGTKINGTISMPGTCTSIRVPSIGTREGTNAAMDGRIYGIKAYNEFFTTDDQANQVHHEFELEANIDFDGSATIGDCT